MTEKKAEGKIEKFARLCRAAVPEGITLLETDGALPLRENESVAMFGRGQFEYVKSGTGSGGRVNCDYVTTIEGELKKRVRLFEESRAYYADYIEKHPFDTGGGWQALPSQKQPVPPEELVLRAAKACEKAIFVLCRTCGEGYDAKAVKGDWYLSCEEEETIALLTKHFNHVIVLVNGGNQIDLNWIKKYSVGTAALIWQGGQEGGAGTADMLMGDVPPSGRMIDTAVKNIETHPAAGHFGDSVKNVHTEDIYVGYRYYETFAQDEVLYPFGYGLSYTTFERQTISAEKNGDEITLKNRVKNTGGYAGKDVVQAYFSYPETKLGAPARQLIAFKKTALLRPGESEIVTLKFSAADMAAYDDCGASGAKYAYVLETGEYKVYAGANVRAAEEAFSFTQSTLRVVKQCSQRLAPEEAFERLTRNGFQPVQTAEYNVWERAKAELPAATEITGDKGITLRDVKSGAHTLDEFVAQFSERELCEIVRGEGMSSPKAPVPGTASCFAGVAKAWGEKGVPVVTTCDGPSGVRMESAARATCIPSGSLIASSWNSEAFDGVLDAFAEEAAGYGVDVILAPGVNLHRYPLCGRSFEYYSEDPYLAGTFAAKFAERFTKKGVFATIKHFAVNSQETNRCAENEVLSERALRELYLKVFEIAVQSGYVSAIMTSYNRINGVSAAGNYDLTTGILRGEWGYRGMVMSDWWPLIDNAARTSHDGKNLAEMVKAQNDVYMVVPDATTYEDNLTEALASGFLTVGELQRCAKNVLRFAMETLAFKSGRTADFDDLSAADEFLCGASLENLPFEKATEKDVHCYREKMLKKITLRVPEEGFYCAEFSYSFPCNPLEQRRLEFSLDGREPLVAVLGGTNGQTKKTRLKVYLKRESVLAFPDDCARGVAIYRLK